MDRKTEKEIDNRLLTLASNLNEKAETRARATAAIFIVSPRLARFPDVHPGLLAGCGSRDLRSRAASRAVGIKYRPTEVFLDEISAAHKPIDQVMAEASELVTNVRALLQMLIEKAASTADVALRRRLRGATSVRELGRELDPSLGASSTLCPERARARLAPAPSTSARYPSTQARAPSTQRALGTLSFCRSLEFSQGRALGWQGNRHLAGVHIDRRNQHETAFPSLDLPVIVVAEQMVMSTKQNAVVDVRAAAVSCTVFGVVGLSPRWWSLTSGEQASAIANREGLPLFARIQPTVAAHVEGVIAVVEKNRLDR